MSYYDSSNKIRRRKVNSSNSHKNSIDSDIVTSRYKQENNKINRKKIDEDFELEKEIYYKMGNFLYFILYSVCIIFDYFYFRTTKCR